MARIVMKFGGAALSTLELIKEAAIKIKKKLKSYDEIIIVASAMGSMTDDLLELAKKMNPNPPKREQDMLLTAGERISMSLLSIALDQLGINGVSLTGSQSGIITTDDHSNAYIIDVRPIRIPNLLKENGVVVVAGFQGVSEKKEITTLGRGGSDTTAIALGVALNAEKVEFYKDVEGFYTDDPKIDSLATLIEHLNYDEALELIKLSGRYVVHPRAIELAKKNGIPVHILPYQKESLAKKGKGSWIIDSAFRPPSRAVYEKEFAFS
ncbi:MAG: aspartate kinase [Rhabdochlamydiaceae bacterium]|nr:aspartate kinase [Candidatus Amphrikana amoebophyrae]